jgi:hypothetical protein
MPYDASSLGKTAHNDGSARPCLMEIAAGIVAALKHDR